MIPALRCQKQDGPCSSLRVVLHGEFQVSQSYTVRPSLIKREQVNIYVQIVELEVDFKSERTIVVKHF